MLVTFRSALVLAALLVLIAGCAVTPNAPSTGTTPAVSQPTGASASNPVSGSPPAASVPVSGTVTLNVVPEKSQAGYRVTEQLVGLSLPDDAVGATHSITGTIVGMTDGSIVSAASKFVVDLRTLKSDQSQRDNFIQRTPLQTSQYPYATFVPTSATGLPTSLPGSLQGSFKLIGDLTVRDVTKSETWDASCQVQSSQTEATCHATTFFTFEDFNLTQPKIGRVLSIVDKLTLEIDVDLVRVMP